MNLFHSDAIRMSWTMSRAQLTIPSCACSPLDRGAETHHELCRLASLNGLLLASRSNRRSMNRGTQPHHPGIRGHACCGGCRALRQPRLTGSKRELAAVYTLDEVDNCTFREKLDNSTKHGRPNIATDYVVFSCDLRPTRKLGPSSRASTRAPKRELVHRQPVIQ